MIVLIMILNNFNFFKAFKIPCPSFKSFNLAAFYIPNFRYNHNSRLLQKLLKQENQTTHCNIQNTFQATYLQAVEFRAFLE